MTETHSNTLQIIQVRITGRVQGVSYRAWTVKSARGLGLKGWVRNRRDGSVEALFAGDEIRIAQMIEKCHAGPLMAQVASVSVLSLNPEEAIADTFCQLPTM